MFAIFVKAFIDYSKTGAGYAKPIFGIQVPIVIGIGGLLLGVPLMLLCALKYREFFSRKLEVARRRHRSTCELEHVVIALLAMQPTVAPGAALPWWIEDALALEGGRVDLPPVQGDLDVDVAIVGGGYTGLWTALALRERDPSLRVAVLEAEYCGAGPSGRNGGFLETYWPAFGELRERFGDEAALRLATLSERIPGRRRSARRGRLAAARRDDDGRDDRSGRMRTSTTPSRPRAAAGRPEHAVPLSAAEVAERCRSPFFRRGVLFPDCSTVHPGRLVRALRRAALAAGVSVYEGTRVTAVEPGVLRTAGGTVRAAEIVVATNAAMTDWRPVRGRLTVFGSYIVLTEPVPELLAEIGWTGGEAIVDARMFLHYFRTTNDGRVLMGSGSGPIGRGNRIDRRFTHDAATAGRAELGLRRLLPGLAAARVERAWGGPDRRLGRPPAVRRHGARLADPLRRRVFGQRRRPVVARRPGPRVARDADATTSSPGCRS